MSNQEADKHLPDEERLAGLIRQGGARVRPDAGVEAAVRNAVAAQWRAMAAGRARRRRQRWSLAAAAAVAGLAISITLPYLLPAGPVVAAVARVSGPVDVDSGRLFSTAARAGAGQPLRVGSEIRSGTGGRLALDINGMALRLDQDSELRLLAADRVELRRGAVYFDSGSQAAAATRLSVETRLGSVEHLGTQYETRISADELRVRVREGSVQLLVAGGQAVQGTAGEQVTLAAGGAVSRQRIARGGDEWAWVGEVAPAYDIQNHTLLEFLRWVSRETGRELAFQSPAVEQAARTAVLHGSIQGLSPERALSAVLVTTTLRYSETAGELRVDFKAGD